MRGAGLLVAALLILCAAPAHAERDRRAASAHFQQGSALYADGRWADALAEFQAGYDAYPLRGFLVNIGQCYRKLDRYDEAADAWRRFLDTHPSDARLREEVTDALAEVDGLRPKSDKRVEPPPAPAPPPVETAPPQLESAPTEAAAPALTSTMALTAPAPREERAPKKSKKWVWAVVSVTLVSVAAAAVTVGVVEGQSSTPRSGSLGLIDGRR
jgi:tetratricopeptide (TPR) repeat protein